MGKTSVHQEALAFPSERASCNPCQDCKRGRGNLPTLWTKTQSSELYKYYSYCTSSMYGQREMERRERRKYPDSDIHPHFVSAFTTGQTADKLRGMHSRTTSVLSRVGDRKSESIALQQTRKHREYHGSQSTTATIASVHRRTGRCLLARSSCPSSLPLLIPLFLVRQGIA